LSKPRIGCKTVINPGAAKKSDWDRVAYKGGSEPGVLSMTTWLEKDGHQMSVDARPSDAIAVAVTCVPHLPIYVEESVLDDSAA
jgi:hypothetical protein